MTSTLVAGSDLDRVPPESGGAVAYVPLPLSRRIRAAEPRFFLADSWEVAADRVLACGGGVVVADPTADGGDIGLALAELCTRLPSIVPVAYARLTPDLVAHLRRLARFEFSDVVIADYDDLPARFVALADMAGSASLTEHVLACLGPSLVHAPANVRRAIRDLFQSPQRYRSVGDLAASASTPRRSLYRSIEALGLASPRLLMAAARVIRAVGLLRDRRCTLRAIAGRLGYAKSDQLADHVALLTGLRVRDARRADPTVLVSVISSRLRLHTDGNGLEVGK